MAEELSEDCFARTALDFVRGTQALEWRASGARMLVTDPQYIDEGVIPVGGTWARNPVPVIVGHGEPYSGCSNATGNLTSAVNATNGAGLLCRQFEPPCAGDDSWATIPGAKDVTDVSGRCSGAWVDGVIVDNVTVPSSLAPGRYVLGFRWDAEQTSQVWSSCADVLLV